jgi:hypothetical protein
MKDVETLAVVTLAIAVYAVATYFFYRTMASRDFVRLRHQHRPEAGGKVRASAQFSLNVLLLPVLVVFWYAVLGLLLVVIADPARSTEIGDILLIAAALVAATRLCAYLREDLARDLGKILPLTLLGVVLVGEQLPELDRVETSLREYEWEESAVLTYGLTLVVLEVALRVLYRSTRFVMALLTRGPDEEPRETDHGADERGRQEATPSGGQAPSGR